MVSFVHLLAPPAKFLLGVEVREAPPEALLFALRGWPGWTEKIEQGGVAYVAAGNHGFWKLQI